MLLMIHISPLWVAFLFLNKKIKKYYKSRNKMGGRLLFGTKFQNF